MLRGVIKSLYEHYNLDPETYTVSQTEKPSCLEEDVQDPQRPEEETSLETPKIPEKETSLETPKTPEKETSLETPKTPEKETTLETPKTPGDYSGEEELEQPEREILYSFLPEFDIPKTPGEEPPAKKKKLQERSTPIAKRKAKRNRKKRVVYSPKY